MNNIIVNVSFWEDEFFFEFFGEEYFIDDDEFFYFGSLVEDVKGLEY